MADPLKREVTAMGTWAAIRHKKTGEIAVYHWSTENDVGKKLLLTNCLKKVSGVQESNNPPSWDEYKFMFNTCDDMNADIGKWWWPHVVRTFRRDVFASTVLNALAIWLELQGPQEEEPFTRHLLVQLERSCLRVLPVATCPTVHWPNFLPGGRRYVVQFSIHMCPLDFRMLLNFT